MAIREMDSAGSVGGGRTYGLARVDGRNTLQRVQTLISRWLDDVANCLSGMNGRAWAGPKVTLVERTSGDFLVRQNRSGRSIPKEDSTLRIENETLIGRTPSLAWKLLAGAQVEVALTPDRFVFQPLELPLPAREFLDGVVRSQIDRLTPWTPSEAVFGWSAPREIGADRMVVTVAATTREQISPLVARAHAESGQVHTIVDAS